MLEFAVQIEGDTKGRWVLAIDTGRDRFLVADDDKAFFWVAISECKLLKAKNPEAPQTVIVAQPEQPLVVARPSLGSFRNGN